MLQTVTYVTVTVTVTQSCITQKSIEGFRTITLYSILTTYQPYG